MMRLHFANLIAALMGKAKDASALKPGLKYIGRHHSGAVGHGKGRTKRRNQRERSNRRSARRAAKARR